MRKQRIGSRMKFFRDRGSAVSARPMPRARRDQTQRPSCLRGLLRSLVSFFASLLVRRASTGAAASMSQPTGCHVSCEEGREERVDAEQCTSNRMRQSDSDSESHSMTPHDDHISGTEPQSVSPGKSRKASSERPGNILSPSTSSHNSDCSGGSLWQTTEDSSDDFSILGFGSGNSRENLPGKSQIPYDRERVLGATSNVEYEVRSCLGSGGFGRVYKCVSKTTGENFALKIPRCGFEDCLQEAKVMEVVRAAEGHYGCRYVIRLEERAMETTAAAAAGSEKLEAVGLIMELCDFDLARFLRRYVLPQAVQMEFTRHLIVGLDFIHSIGVTHTDLYTDNVLVSMKEACLKISDFGHSRLRKIEDAPISTQTTGASFPGVYDVNGDVRDDLNEAGRIVVMLWLEDRTKFSKYFDVAHCVYRESACRGEKLGDGVDQGVQNVCKQLRRWGIHMPACIVKDFLMECFGRDEDDDDTVSAKKIACKMEEHVSAEVRQESSLILRTFHETYSSQKAESGSEMQSRKGSSQ